MKRTILSIILVSGLAAAATGCAAQSGASSSAGAEQVPVVASTNVWGSVAEAIGGDAVAVTSLITSSAQDPHEFEATARDQLAVSKAAIVIENGGGYDDFMQTLLGAAGSDPVLLDAVELSGLQSSASASAAQGEFNEHVWYDFGVVRTVAKAFADELTTAKPASASLFAANLTAFAAKLDALDAKLAGLKSAHAGVGVAITEPVPLYMLQAAGLVNKTPAAFSEAIEAGTDVPALVLQDVEKLFSDGTAKLLAYNDQTVTAQTESVVAAATSAGVPVVSFSETLPDGADYITWMTTNIDALEKALA